MYNTMDIIVYGSYNIHDNTLNLHNQALCSPFHALLMLQRMEQMTPTPIIEFNNNEGLSCDTYSTHAQDFFILYLMSRNIKLVIFQ